MKDPQIKNKQTDLLSDNHYILNKVTFDYQKMTILGLPKREFMTEEMDLQYYFTTQNKNSHSNSSVSFTNVPQRKQNRDDD
jgi:hypothetical protein